MPEVPESKPLKSTLNLPQTSFAMKANLPVNEPVRLDAWQQMGLYERIRDARAGAPKYVLHDGPPYANGAIHLGHALNKCLKDFVIKTKSMAGFDAPYVPGWDCHGLPIEVKVDEKLGRKKLEMDPIAVRQACREYAQNFVDIQRDQFIRLGVLGRWQQPYLTMSFPYEADIVETFFGFFEKGFVYKGLKPVSWCIHDQTALAEAEVEYEQHTSPSVYVRYKLKSDPAAIDPALAGKDLYTIIWTTTPWTLPASLAVAFHPEMEYVALDCEGGVYIIAEPLLAKTVQECGLKSAKATDEGAGQADIVVMIRGAKLEGITLRHPFLDRDILGVTADYVTAEQGTGAVHTAPAHGADDFATGKRYNLPEVQYVDNAGRQRNTGLHGGGGVAQSYDGLPVFKSNPVIIELLKEKGALLSATNFEHSYPHCWRCHNPVIVRATEQWFIDMETPMPAANGEAEGKKISFRQRALDAVAATKWDPTWGKERISNMVASRPDWCISRQRVWGVPIAVFLCNQCHEPLNDPAINASVVTLFRKEGCDPWYARDAASLLPGGTKCANCGGSEFRKEMDILDVWFESGASWHAVLEAEPELGLPCDLYAEGGDQHRGWFQSSLLNCVGLRGHAPYRMATTIGWTLDEQGRAMSKSLGNVVDPVDIAKRLGAEIVRLWVASVDFREDVAASEKLMERVSDNYRKLRNTFRFLLGNLHDFEPAANAVTDFAKLEPLDQYILSRLAEIDAKIRKSYEDFEFHRAYHTLNEFTNTDLSSLYLDVVKDRLYTFAPNHPARRSAQTVLWQVAETLTRLVAPILSFTSDEVWQHLPQVVGREESVHIALFSGFACLAAEGVSADDWNRLLEIRTGVMREIEVKRQEGQIGKGLMAQVSVSTTTADHALLTKYRSALEELFNVSKVNLEAPAESIAAGPEGIQAVVNPALGEKCERCWRYVPDVGKDARWSTVCLRCADALAAIGYPAQESK